MKSEWKTFENIHLDMNPWGYVANGKKVFRLLHHINSYCSNLSAFQSAETRTRNTDKLKNLTYSRRSDFVTENNEVDNDEVSVQALVNFADNIERDGMLIPFNIQSSESDHNILEGLVLKIQIFIRNIEYHCPFAKC